MFHAAVRFAVTAAIAMLAGFIDAAPQLWGAFAMNGRLSVLLNTTAEQRDASLYVLQRYDDSAAAWTDVGGLYGIYTRGDNYYWLLETPDLSLSGQNTWRIRYAADADVEENWTRFTANSSTPISGTVSFASQYDGSTPGGCAFDGSPATYFEPADHDTKWISVDFGAPKLISGISYIPRSNYGNATSNMRTARFESSTNGTFEEGDRETVYTIPDEEIAWGSYHVDLETPVLTRYMRLWMAADSGYWFNVAEIQFEEALQVVSGDAENGYACVVVPKNTVGATVYRAVGTEGAFEEIGTIPAGKTTLLDRSLPWGVTARYKTSLNSDYVVPYTRTHQIDRKASDQTQTFNCTPFMARYGVMQTGPEAAFDGDAATNPGAYTSDGWGTWYLYNPGVGVDYGEAIRAHVVSCRLQPCADWVANRANGLAVFGANSLDDIPTGGTRLSSAAVSGAQPGVWVELSCRSAGSYRYLYVYNPDQEEVDGSSNWCGNIAEIQFYGWTTYDEDEADGRVEIAGVDEDTGVPTLTFAESYAGPGGVAFFRAEEENGGYAMVGSVSPGVQTWTDTKARFYAANWYRIAKIAADGTVGALSNRRVSYVRNYHLERLSDKTTLRGSCSMFGRNYPEDATGSDTFPLAFDGNLSTNPDIYGYDGGWILYNPAIGIDFGEEVRVAKCRLAPFSGYRSRVTGLAVFGTNDPDEIAQGGTMLSEVVADNGETWIDVDCSSASAYRYVYVRSYNGADSGGWCGNVAEVEFYGWTKSEGKRPGFTVIVR